MRGRSNRMGNCHCRDCQRASGSSYDAALLVPESAVSITGEPKYYDVTGASAGIVSIMVGSLDDPSWYRPQADVYTASASAGASDRSGLTLTTQTVIRCSPV